MSSHMHVHFGAGRLGLGLVVPILVHRQEQHPNARFAIFQRPKHDCWHGLQVVDEVDVVINKKGVTRLRCVNDHTPLERLHTLLSQSREPLLVSASRIELLTPILALASSFSTAVGVAGLSGVQEGLALVPAKSKRAPLFAFENDTEAIQKLASAASHLVEVIPVSCDRVCMERRIHNACLELDCEEFEGCAVLCGPVALPGLPPTYSPRGVCVTLTNTGEEREFYARRKFLILNCTRISQIGPHSSQARTQ